MTLKQISYFKYAQGFKRKYEHNETKNMSIY